MTEMPNIAALDHLLTTTRSVRKRLDLTRPVEPDVITRCLEIAAQAPTGSNRQKWRFVVVTDPALRQGLADLYRRSFAAYAGTRSGSSTSSPVSTLAESATYLAEHFHEVPVHVIFCYEGRVETSTVANQAGFYGSILPAAWSFMLALRARGLGTAWTTLHLAYEREAATLLDIPDTWTQTVLFPVAYFTGSDFKPAAREGLAEKIVWR